MTATSPSMATSRSRGVVARILLKVVGVYRLTAPARVPRCRYIPTCSAYAEEAIERYGAGRGSWLALRRLLRCHPFGSFGLDPVPDLDPPADSTDESAPSAQSLTGES